MINITIRHYGSVHYLTAETRAAAELVRTLMQLAAPTAVIEVTRGDTVLC
jgi:hypothetical protein